MKFIPEWKKHFATANNRMLAALTVVVFVFTLFSYATFLADVELRSGVTFTDPLHVLAGPSDLSWLVFLCIYSAVVATFVALLHYPEALFRALRAYTVLVGIRIVAMWSLPLDPPATMIPLVDPIVEFFTTSNASSLSKDLFFSGHTATLSLLALVAPFKWLRVSLVFITAVVALAVVVQHVHYTVDVVVAPFMAISAYVLTGKPQN